MSQSNPQYTQRMWKIARAVLTSGPMTTQARFKKTSNAVYNGDTVLKINVKGGHDLTVPRGTPSGPEV